MTVNLESHTLNCIASLWKEQKHTDVTFLVGDIKERVCAHRAILASHSSYFKSLLYGDMLEAEKDEIVLFDVPQPRLFVSLMGYAYTGQLHILKEVHVLCTYMYYVCVYLCVCKVPIHSVSVRQSTIFLWSYFFLCRIYLKSWHWPIGLL